MNNKAKIQRFLRIKVAQWYHIIIIRDKNVNKYAPRRKPYRVAFYANFNGLGANAGCIALCSFRRRDIEFNMHKVMLNSDNLPGLEALVIHEICHIPSPRNNGAHGPAFEKIYLKYAGDLASAIDTLVL